MTESRRFSLKQRRALFSASHGLCEMCGVVLESGWHADHYIPWSLGGSTDVINGQALCPPCNLRKGKKTVITYDQLRPWQKKFSTKFSRWEHENFFLVALPGGGKTFAALHVAHEFLSSETIRQRYIIVVVPSRNLRRQWQNQASKHFGIELQTKEFDGALKAGMHGIVLTYGAVAADPSAYRRLCARNDVFVIFDEPHHMSSEAAWGIAALEAFTTAIKRLSMSGTPWRSDGVSIPFLDRDEETGEYIIHERFDWPLALEEEPQAIRHLVFPPYHGSADILRDDKNLKLSTHDELSDEEEATCLRALIKEQLFASSMIRDAHQKLMELRKSKRDAGGLVVCMDILHAESVAQWLETVTGVRPYLVVSDDEVSQGDTIKRFEDERGIWIVSVRQVSEGVDIPRLMVGVYLTNYTTELYFRQFIGRVARHQQTEDDLEAFVYIPHHSKLVQYAERIKSLQAIAIDNKIKKEDDGPGREPVERGPSSTTILGGSEAERAGVIIPGLAVYSPSSAVVISDFARLYRLTETKAAEILKGMNALDDDVPETRLSDDIPKEERMTMLRRRGEILIRRLHYITKREIKFLQIEANDHIGVKSVKNATEEQLISRNSYISRRIQEEKNNQRI